MSANHSSKFQEKWDKKLSQKVVVVMLESVEVVTGGKLATNQPFL